MAYNYDPDWLVLNADHIASMEVLFSTGDVLVFIDRDIKKIRQKQAFYNNLLASIAVNRPDLGHLRSTLRTWVRVENGEWSLFVGKPSHKIKGRPNPTIGTPDPLVLHTQRNEPKVTNEGVYIDKGYDDVTVPMLMLELIKQCDTGVEKIIVRNLNISDPDRLLIPSLRRLATDYKLEVSDLEQDEAKIIRGLTLVRR